ncbi:MAG: molybdenum cofactor guanylyltransferase [Phycisphaeraceae bacterium]|nr:MAG: molybdenum cofactor guanylyltransferase [Phycisphaeraceae bacterium]
MLVGGKSTRFGRDKLREPIECDGELLVQRPISALRAVFGQRVKLVGQCHPSMVSMADGVIVDDYPGSGPMGGVLSALRRWGGPIFVLAGDMPAFDAHSVREIAALAEIDREATVVVARSDRIHPCAGIYTQAAIGELYTRLASGDFRLGDMLLSGNTRTVPIVPCRLVNLNRQYEFFEWSRSESARISTGANATLQNRDSELR